jgi:DHA2 family multidrug resistance protein
MAHLNLRLAASFAFLIFGSAVFWAATLNENATFLQFAAPRLVQGLGMAFFFLPINQIMMSGVLPNDLASASGVSNFTRTMASSFSTAITVWIWNQRSDYHHALLTEHVNNASQSWTAYQGDLAAHGITGVGAYQYVNQLISNQALTLGVNDVFNMLGLLFFLLIPCIWFAKPPFGARANPMH